MALRASLGFRVSGKGRAASVSLAWRLALVCLWLTMAASASGQTIYMWEDADGVTHFTDRKPDTDREVTVQRAVAELRDIVGVQKTGPKDAPVWMFTNRIHGPVTVRVSLVEEENVVSEPRLPADFVLDALEQRELVTLGPLDERRSWQYRFRTAAVPGRAGGRHQPSRPYRPPFAPGETFRVGQAFGGEHSHGSADSFHAVDITMPMGSPVHAARGGVVMDVARYFHRAGVDRERHGPRANFVRILHEDGSMALYAHLDYEGVLVAPGQRVERGQLIGRSGNTGYSTGPHLHFVIQVVRGLELVSVPFEFEGEGSGATPPRSGQRLSLP